MTKVITANDFFKKLFELKILESDYASWKISKQRSNEPRYYRLLQITAILKYLDIQSVQDFVSGKFLLKKDKVYYDNFLSEVRKYLKLKYRKDINLKFRKSELREAFNSLMNYREIIQHLADYQSGVMEASGIYLWTYGKISDANSYLKSTINYTNKLLSRFINPRKEISIKVEELVKKYKYPDVDLKSIDMDNF